jgi:hypothetical protein
MSTQLLKSTRAKTLYEPHRIHLRFFVQYNNIITLLTIIVVYKSSNLMALKKTSASLGKYVSRAPAKLYLIHQDSVTHL